MSESLQLFQVFQDVDECLVNSVIEHTRWTPIVAKAMGLDWPDEEIPDYETVCAKGGTHAAFGHLPRYHDINKKLRENVAFNTELPPIEGAKEALLELFNLGLFGKYLTTRPSFMAKPTADWLASMGLPNIEVIARPDEVPLEQTTQWKLGVLVEEHERTGIPIVMIDDSKSMRDAIHKLDHPHIVGVVYDGPMTPKGNGEMKWRDIKNLLLNATSWAMLAEAVKAKGVEIQ